MGHEISYFFPSSPDSTWLCTSFTIRLKQESFPSSTAHSWLMFLALPQISAEEESQPVVSHFLFTFPQITSRE